MLLSWQRGVALFASTFALFLVLFIISHAIYHRYLRHLAPLALSGSIIMAVGVFAFACLPQLNIPPIATLIIALELLLVWAYTAIRLMQTYVKDHLSLHRLSNRFAIGTWVIGTVIIVLLVDQTESTLHGFIVLLSMIALLLYAFYVAVMVDWLVKWLPKRAPLVVNGGVLFVAIATLSIALLLNELFRQDISPVFYQAIILAGAFFYLLGVLPMIWTRFERLASTFLPCNRYWDKDFYWMRSPLIKDKRKLPGLGLCTVS